MPTPCPRILLSATLREDDISRCTNLLGNMKPNVISGPLDRRSILFRIHISGDATSTLKRRVGECFKKSPNMQQIIFTHSRTNAENQLINMCDGLLEKNRAQNDGPDSIAMAFVGTDGIMMKTTTMDAIANYEHLSGEGTVYESPRFETLFDKGTDQCDISGTNIELPKVQIIVATKSAQAGISSNHLKYAHKKGLPSTPYEQVQEMGRVDRLLLSIMGSNSYEVHLDFKSYVSLYIRIMKCDNTAERKVLFHQLHTVLSYLVVPRCCYHTFIEQYFEYDGRAPDNIEWEAREDKEDCGLYCSHCLGDVPHFTKRVSKHGVVSFLTVKVFSAAKNPTCAQFMKAMKGNKQLLFHADDVPKGTKMGQIHALALQLLANGIIGLVVEDQTKIGTDKLNQDHTGVTLLNAKNGHVMLPAYFVDSCWKGMNIV